MLLETETELLDNLKSVSQLGAYSSWGYVTRDKKGVATYTQMANRPCWGEMRAYGKLSTRPSDHKPSDLTRPMKAGLIREGIAVRIGGGDYDNSQDIDEKALEYLLSSESPWRRGLKNPVVYREDGKPRAIIMTDTDVDPTVMVSFFMILRIGAVDPNISKLSEEFGLSIPETILMKIVARLGHGKNYNPATKTREETFYMFPRYSNQYNIAINLDPKRWINGDSSDLSNGRTWRDAEDYNRPELPNIFNGDSPVDDLVMKGTGLNTNSFEICNDIEKIKIAVENVKKLLS